VPEPVLPKPVEVRYTIDTDFHPGHFFLHIMTVFTLYQVPPPEVPLPPEPSDVPEPKAQSIHVQLDISVFFYICRFADRQSNDRKGRDNLRLLQQNPRLGNLISINSCI